MSNTLCFVGTNVELFDCIFKSKNFTGGDGFQYEVGSLNYQFRKRVSDPAGFNPSWPNVISPSNKMVMDVPVMDGEVSKVKRDKIIFNFVVEVKTVIFIEVG